MLVFFSAIFTSALFTLQSGASTEWHPDSDGAGADLFDGDHYSRVLWPVPTRRACDGTITFKISTPGQGTKSTSTEIGHRVTSTVEECASECFHLSTCTSADFGISGHCRLFSSAFDKHFGTAPRIKLETSDYSHIKDINCSSESQEPPQSKEMLPNVTDGVDTHLEVLNVSEVFNFSCGVQKILAEEIFNLTKGLPGSKRIIGGAEAKPHSWPWQVSVVYKRWHICGGTLVDANHVITAAHCFGRRKNIKDYRIALGLHDFATTTYITSRINKVTIHPKFGLPTSVSNDIAILELKDMVILSEKIHVVCLPLDTVTTGQLCVVTGWGITEVGSVNVLQQVAVPVIDVHLCNSSNYYHGVIDSGMLCAGYEEGGKDACKGDSGGPLICLNKDGLWELQGVVSWGFGCALPHRPGVYTRVANFLSWILENMNVVRDEIL